VHFGRVDKVLVAASAVRDDADIAVLLLCEKDLGSLLPVAPHAEDPAREAVLHEADVGVAILLQNYIAIQGGQALLLPQLLHLARLPQPHIALAL